MTTERCQAWVHHPHSVDDTQCNNVALPTIFPGEKRYCTNHRPDRPSRTGKDRAVEEIRRLRTRNTELLAVVERLIHLDSRLRLRSPATLMEIQVWAELREAAKAAIAKAEGEV